MLSLITIALLTALLPSANGLKCRCDEKLQKMDTKLKEVMAGLQTPVCVNGFCDITAHVPQGSLPLCSYFDSDYYELNGYYCGLGINDSPSTKIIAEAGNVEVKATHCTSDNCDAKPADARNPTPAPKVTSLECRCDASLGTFDAKMKQEIPRLVTPVCNNGKCNIASQLDQGIPLCTYFQSDVAILKGYYCSAGLTANPSSMIVKELASTEVKMTHCTTDNCDAKPVSAANTGDKSGSGTGSVGGGAAGLQGSFVILFLAGCWAAMLW